MPFSFKPEISPADTGAQGGAAVSAAPQASFGGASTSSMMARETEHGTSAFHALLFFVFGATVFISAALFAYMYYLSSQVEGKKATLASYEAQLATLPLEDMRKLSNRIKIINTLVREHPSANVAFRIIEDSVENQVVYKRFELRYNDQAKSYALQLGGVAPDYKSVAQQVDTLKRKPYTTYIPSVSVEGLQPDDLGRIGFTLKMPITIAGLLPEGLNLSDGAAARVASSTDSFLQSNTVQTSSSTIQVGSTTQATSTPKVGTSTQPKATTTPKR